jgi:adenylate kinase
MKLIIFGPPGSGKGTYSSRIAPKFNIPHIATGDIFREIAKSETPLGKKVAEYLNKGELVPDNIVIEILKERISKEDCKNGFILDGYPRTIPQAEALEKITKIDKIINLVVPEDVIIQRLSTRRICKKCGSIFNIRTLPPKKEGICDYCGGELYQREDDKPEVIRERLKIYQRQTEPLLNFYKGKVPIINIECNSVDIPPEIIVDKILKELEK